LSAAVAICIEKVFKIRGEFQNHTLSTLASIPGHCFAIMKAAEMDIQNRKSRKNLWLKKPWIRGQQSKTCQHMHTTQLFIHGPGERGGMRWVGGRGHTVVIHFENTAITTGAVMRTVRFEHVTPPTNPELG